MDKNDFIEFTEISTPEDLGEVIEAIELHLGLKAEEPKDWDSC
jgi:hypothetical protein